MGKAVKKDQYIYVAEDGSWGDAYGMVVIDTSRWSKRDYDEFNDWSEDQRTIYTGAFRQYGINPDEFAKWQGSNEDNTKEVLI